MKDVRFPKEQQEKLTRYGVLNDEKIKLEKEMNKNNDISDDIQKKYDDIISEMNNIQEELNVNIEIEDKSKNIKENDSNQDKEKLEIQSKIDELNEKLKNIKKPKVLLSALLIMLGMFFGGFFSMIYPIVGIPLLGFSIYKTIKFIKNTFNYEDLKSQIKKLEKSLNKGKGNKESKFSKVKNLFKKKGNKKEAKLEKTKNWFKNKFSKKHKEEIIESNNIDNEINNVSSSSDLISTKDNDSKVNITDNKKEKIEELKQHKENILNGEYRLSKKDIIQDKINVNEICNHYKWNNTNPYYKKQMVKTYKSDNQKAA